ncbi:putative retrotransposon gag domain, aspartic peptidase domain protein [Tanacetum coccineum]
MAIETEKNAASGSMVIDENRGRDDVRQNPKKRGTSKDVVASLDQRVAGFETSRAELKNQVKGLEGLDSDITSMRDDFRVALNTLSGDLKCEIHDLRYSFMGEITKIREEFEEEEVRVATKGCLHLARIHQVIKDLQVDMALCKQSLASGGGNTNHGPKIDVPKPSPFVGKREARAVDDFLWEMEQYLEEAILSENAKNEAKSRLYKLKQSGTIREYVKEFTTLVLEIPELFDQDSLFYFLDVRGGKRLSRKIGRARDCPKKASLKGLSAHGDEEASDGGSMGSIRILNAIKAKTEVPKVIGKGLQYVEATINDVKVHALVDSGATHNFVADDEAKRLGINATKGSGTIKAVNSPAKAIHGVAKDVRAKISVRIMKKTRLPRVLSRLA